MENKQTAVEWLFKRMNEIRVDDESCKLNVLEFFKLQFEAQDQAKAMEKEQIKRAYNKGVVNEISIYSTISEEQYYEETYGK